MSNQSIAQSHSLSAPRTASVAVRASDAPTPAGLWILTALIAFFAALAALCFYMGSQIG